MRAKKSKPEETDAEYFAKLEETDKVVDLKESRIGKELIESRKEGMNILLSVYTDLERISERIGNNLPQWCVAYTNITLEEWYRQAVILPPKDCARIRKKLKGPLDFFRLRDERDKRIAAARDISEVDEHIEQDRGPHKQYDPDIPDPTPWEREEGDRPVTTKELEKLLLLVDKIEKDHEKKLRVRVGRVYYQMREIVQNGNAGDDPETGKLWDWTKWAEIHIRRPERTIQGNIKAYLDQL